MSWDSILCVALANSVLYKTAISGIHNTLQNIHNIVKKFNVHYFLQYMYALSNFTNLTTDTSTLKTEHDPYHCFISLT